MKANRRAYWTEKGVTPRWQLFTVYVLIVTAGIVGFAITRHQGHRTDQVIRANHNLALQANANAKQAKALAASIQRQRKDLCIDQNKRNHRTVQTLDTVLADFIKKHPEQAKQVKDSVRSNVLIINALAPRRNCSVIQPNP